MIKREWHFLYGPAHFEAKCERCGEIKETTWSEYVSRLWCYKCEDDIVITSSLLNGPIPIMTAEAMGICFDRVIIATGETEKFNSKTGEWET